MNTTVTIALKIIPNTLAYHPLFLYKIRWNIEISYYEQKKFWSFCRYMVLHTHGIELLINIINLAYNATKLLPYVDANFVSYQAQNPQEFRFFLNKQIREQLIFLPALLYKTPSIS